VFESQRSTVEAVPAVSDDRRTAYADPGRDDSVACVAADVAAALYGRDVARNAMAAVVRYRTGDDDNVPSFRLIVDVGPSSEQKIPSSELPVMMLSFTFTLGTSSTLTPPRQSKGVVGECCSIGR
jgi:hypothetical protein